MTNLTDLFAATEFRAMLAERFIRELREARAEVRRLQAALTGLREQIADEIEAEQSSNTFRNVVLLRAAAIARGVAGTPDSDA